MQADNGRVSCRNVSHQTIISEEYFYDKLLMEDAF